MTAKTFGEFFKDRRIARGLTLRAFCAEAGLDAGNLSKLERGILPPPESREKLEEYAKHLRIEEGSAAWFELFDLAAAEKGRLPADLADDQEIVARLPLLFRTLRGERVSDEKMDLLVKHLRVDRSGRGA
jgi:transcriptional regulator with XRE-family HTH domain